MVLRKLFLFLCLPVFCSIISANAGLAEVSARSTAPAQNGVVSGRIMIKGDGPLSWGEVMLYNTAAGPPPMPAKYDRTPDITRTLDNEGNFSVNVSPGKYYLGAVKRMSGDRIGTPQEGDFALLSVDGKGILKEYAVKAGEVLDIGTIAEARRLEAKDLVKRSASTAIRGSIVDTDGKPVENALVLAYVDLSLRGKPLFVSDRSDRAGNYLLRVAPGTYYLRARNGLTSGPPQPGDIVGYYGEGNPTPLTLKEGEIRTGINFTVVLFGGRGPQPGAGQ